MSDIDVAIIGAGSAGIAAARHLLSLRPDLSVRLLEAGSRIGGRAHTVAVGPEQIPVDLGCGWLHGGRDNIWTVIAARTGFTLDRTPAPWDRAQRQLGLTQRDNAAAEQALGAFFERAETTPTADMDPPLSALLEPGGQWNGLIEAIGTYINGVELERASLLDYQRYEPGRGPDPRVREGYGSLIAHFGQNLPVSLNTAVTRIEHGGHDLVIETERGSMVARALIVSVPTGELAAERIRFDPPLSDKVEAASRLPLGLANKTFLSLPADADFADELYVMGVSDNVRTAAYHVRPFGYPVIECYFGGACAHELERAGPAATLDFARNELGGHFGTDVARRLELLRMSAWAGTPYIHGSYSYAEPGASDQRGVLAAPVDGRIFFAGEACSPHRFSTAHGAYETGVAAAEAAAGALPMTRRA